MAVQQVESLRLVFFVKLPNLVVEVISTSNRPRSEIVDQTWRGFKTLETLKLLDDPSEIVDSRVLVVPSKSSAAIVLKMMGETTSFDFTPAVNADENSVFFNSRLVFALLRKL